MLTWVVESVRGCCYILSAVRRRYPRIVRSSVDPKPRVLLVDDHQGVLNHVSATLDDGYDVVGVATDGRRALEKAREVSPDVIVLDINMPGLNGFQTMRALQQSGSRVPVVFLSMLDAEDLVGEAFRCGGRGYVVKTHAARDLAGAIDQVLLGRLFAPSLTSLFHLANGGGHAMQLYGEAGSFLDGLAAFFDVALRRGDATCVIATEEVRRGLDTRLQARGWGVGRVSGHERYLVLDADDALRRFMRDGAPQADLLSEIAVELDQYRLSVSGGPTSRLTIFGNMVVSLSEAGNDNAVIELERLWNSLTHHLPFLTLCGYSTSCLNAHAPDLWAKACAEHWAVSHAADD